MSDREGLARVFAEARRTQTAVPGLVVTEFCEAEAIIEARTAAREPLLFVVPCARRNLRAYVGALRSFDAPDLFVQLMGDDVDVLVEAGLELGADAVFLTAGKIEAARALLAKLKGGPMFTEVLLPWQQAAPSQMSEGRIVRVEEAEAVLRLEGLDMAAVPVGGGPGPYKTCRIPLWSTEAFNRVAALRPDLHYSLPWGSLLPKDLLKKYNLYGGALPGVISLPKQQFRAFIAGGAVKIGFRSDLGLAFLCGLRESLYRRPEKIDPTVHLEAAREELAVFLAQRFRDLRP
ncbi:MAG TPA: hypothetical protein PKX48_01760 [Planctomycetota bacterium]|jgi:fructose/tagatose bisphosphate aldolase|nr:hypothetical protein [Planctomycetota bacterium]OQC21633.1 MAG: Fructose-bisphosphate aldolase [Planctomycetes bacterium ADurb.Bin069]HNR98501.1 hypothetical protein [Planctomycetota bacterium]HNU26195.1 hypothetical protein [Planctomycetota bacterium]HOE28725.1 hypothetical protein [Planctomycetota bacterium]